MLEGYIISWVVDDPVTGEEIVNSMPLQEFWDRIQDTTIEYDDLGFYLEDNVSLPVNPPAPEPFQGMEEADIIRMMDEYITSTPEGVELPQQRDGLEDLQELEELEETQDTPFLPDEPKVDDDDVEEQASKLCGKNGVFITAVVVVMVLSLLNEK